VVVSRLLQDHRAGGEKHHSCNRSRRDDPPAALGPVAPGARDVDDRYFGARVAAQPARLQPRFAGEPRGVAVQGDPQRRAELSLQIVKIVVVVHRSDSLKVINALRRSDRTVLAGRSNSVAMSTSARSS
jgi:hypothetical protein